MRYMGFVKMTEVDPQPPQALIDAMGEHMQKGFADGVLIDTGGLYATSYRTEVRVRGGEVTSTDGPFAEAKEVLGGFYLIEAADMDEAVRWAARIPAAWQGKVEVRPVQAPPGSTPPA